MDHKAVKAYLQTTQGSASLFWGDALKWYWWASVSQAFHRIVKVGRHSQSSLYDWVDVYSFGLLIRLLGTALLSFGTAHLCRVLTGFHLQIGYCPQCFR